MIIGYLPFIVLLMSRKQNTVSTDSPYKARLGDGSDVVKKAYCDDKAIKTVRYSNLLGT